MGWAIVAIPEDRDPVWKYSSEKVPHMTLLFLGEQTDDGNLSHITQYIAHIAKTTLQPFLMMVDRRGSLGDEQADVLFFEKDKRRILMPTYARDYLLADSEIKKLYDSTEQFPEWLPHLTMGYPKTPAKKDDREYPGISYVQFDRIALWTGDYTGPEFRLENREERLVAESDMMMSDEMKMFLAHYGVKGQRWGVRKNYSDLRNRPLERHQLKTESGVEVILKEDRIPPIGAAIGSVSQKFRDRLNSGKSFTIEVDGKNVGESSFTEKSKDELNLVWLGVRPEHRGKGYASSVFGAGVAYAKEKGYSKISLEVPGNAPDARHIYEKFGFKATDKKFGEDDEPDVWGGLTEMVYTIKRSKEIA
jgi:ribosomal protein S18 acetylase RimI-like enzyme/2'-5' RNA ligase